MQFGRFPRKTILAATLFLVFNAANASFLEQTGVPSTAPAVMKTYGVDVATRVALKAVIPAGWQLFSHRSVELPEALSWKVDESWVSVLNNFAKANDIAVLIDWDKKGVYFRSTAMAMQEQEKRQMIAQAASTPLPSLAASEVSTTVATVAALAVPAVSAVPGARANSPGLPVVAVRPLPVATLAPTPELHPAVVASVAAGLPATPAVVFAAVTAATPVPALAVAGSPTTVSRSSMPPSIVSAVSVPVPAKFESPTVHVTQTAPASTPSVTPMPAPITTPSPKRELVAPLVVLAQAGPLQPQTLVRVTTLAPAARVADYSEQALTPVRSAGEAFNRQSVDQVIKSTASKHGFSVSWEAADVQFPGPVTVLGADMGEDMKLVLRALGGRRSPLSIDVFRASNVVRVRNASGVAEVAFVDLPFTGAIREKSVATFSVKLRDELVQPPTVVAVAAPASGRSFVPAASEVIAVDTGASASPELPVHAVVPEPVRQDTSVASIKKMESASVAAARAAAGANMPANTESQARPTVGATVAVAGAVLRVERGQALRGAIEALLEPGWTLKWDITGDMEANTPLEVSGESVVAVLNKVLPRMSLSADIYKPSKLIVVRPADAALDK